MESGADPIELEKLRSVTLAALEIKLDDLAEPQVILHPLEFVCVPISRGPEWGICAHLWRVDARPSDVVHAHSWDLYSEILRGEIINEVTEAEEHPTGSHRLIRVHSHGTVDRLVPTGKVMNLGPRTLAAHGAGESYTMAAGTFHRSIPASAQETMTLLLARTRSGHHDQILVPTTTEVQAVRRRELDRDQAFAVVREVRDALLASACR